MGEYSVNWSKVYEEGWVSIVSSKVYEEGWVEDRVNS